MNKKKHKILNPIENGGIQVMGNKKELMSLTSKNAESQILITMNKKYPKI